MRKPSRSRLLVGIACRLSRRSLEPIFMMLGQSTATAASLAIDFGCALQDVPYDLLRAEYRSNTGEILCDSINWILYFNFIIFYNSSFIINPEVICYKF